MNDDESDVEWGERRCESDVVTDVVSDVMNKVMHVTSCTSSGQTSNQVAGCYISSSRTQGQSRSSRQRAEAAEQQAQLGKQTAI